MEKKNYMLKIYAYIEKWAFSIYNLAYKLILTKSFQKSLKLDISQIIQNKLNQKVIFFENGNKLEV